MGQKCYVGQGSTAPSICLKIGQKFPPVSLIAEKKEPK